VRRASKGRGSQKRGSGRTGFKGVRGSGLNVVWVPWVNAEKVEKKKGGGLQKENDHRVFEWGGEMKEIRIRDKSEKPTKKKVTIVTCGPGKRNVRNGR